MRRSCKILSRKTSKEIQKAMRTQDLWAALSANPFPYLHELAPMDRDGFVRLDAYLCDCL